MILRYFIPTYDMRISLSVLLSLFSTSLWSQQDSTAFFKHEQDNKRATHPVITTIALGLIDPYKYYYTLPSGYEKDRPSGYANVNAKLEYCLNSRISIAAIFGYDAFVYNYSQALSWNNNSFMRYKTNNFRSFSGGLTAFYHFGQWINVKHLDPFLGLGVSLNNIRYNEYPQGDSSVIKLTHTATPYVKAGARYYISDKFSFFGDIGYDRQSILSLGFSCRFSKTHASLPPVNGPVSIPVKQDTVIPSIVVTRQPEVSVPDQDHFPPGKKDSGISPDTAGEPVALQKDTVSKTKHPLLNYTTIHFNTGRSAPNMLSYPILDSAANRLKEIPLLILRIDGYTDITGAPDVNRRISQERANAVKRYLLKKGFASNRMVAKGHGSSHPVASNLTKSGRAQNRRVQLSFIIKSRKAGYWGK